MVTPQSPNFLNGLDEDSYKYYNDIGDKMRVPKRIKANGEISDEDLLLSNQNGIMNSWNYHDKIDMNVPDRIVVLGHNAHLETRSAPREITLENTILPKNPSNFVRVQTPPRVLTLSDHHFPLASQNSSPNKIFDNYDDDDYEEIESRPSSSARAVTSTTKQSFPPVKETSNGWIDYKNTSQFNADNSIISQKEGTPIGEITPHEEILYLRRQMAKLNRRVLNLEISNEQKIQREKIIYCFGLAYFVLKAIIWLNKN